MATNHEVANPLVVSTAGRFAAPKGASDAIPLPQQPKPGPKTATHRYLTEVQQLPAGLQLFANFEKDGGMLLLGETLALRLENKGSSNLLR